RIQPTVAQQAAGHRSITQEPDAMRTAELDHAVCRSIVEQRVLDLVRRDRHARVNELGEARHVEIRGAEESNLAELDEASELEPHLDIARRLVIPPVELDEVEAIHPEPSERAIDDALDGGAIDAREHREVRHELRVHLRRPGELRITAAERPD